MRILLFLKKDYIQIAVTFDIHVKLVDSSQQFVLNFLIDFDSMIIYNLLSTKSDPHPTTSLICVFEFFSILMKLYSFLCRKNVQKLGTIWGNECWKCTRDWNYRRDPLFWQKLLLLLYALFLLSTCRNFKLNLRDQDTKCSGNSSIFVILLNSIKGVHK